MKTTPPLKKIIFGLSCITCVYFIFLVYISFYPPGNTQLLRFFGELLTIPLLLALVFLLGLSLYNVLRRKEASFYLPVFLINVFTAVLLAIVTWYDLGS